MAAKDSKVDIINSVSAFVTNELYTARVVYNMDSRQRSAIFKMLDMWKNRKVVPATKVNDDPTQYYFAVDTDRVTGPCLEDILGSLSKRELNAKIEDIVVDLLEYALGCLKNQVGINKDIRSNYYRFSFFIKDGTLVNVYSSADDPFTWWFESNDNGEEIANSSDILKEWIKIIKN